jgi:hypothetical protein
MNTNIPTPRTDAIRSEHRGDTEKLCRALIKNSNELERELHESRHRDARLMEAVTKVLEASRIYFEQYGAEHEEGCPEDDTCNCEKTMPLSLAFTNMAITLSTATPAETYIPWSVVKEAMDAEFAVHYACSDELEEALKRRKVARARLESYAPKQSTEKGQ